MALQSTTATVSRGLSDIIKISRYTINYWRGRQVSLGIPSVENALRDVRWSFESSFAAGCGSTLMFTALAYPAYTVYRIAKIPTAAKALVLLSIEAAPLALLIIAIAFMTLAIQHWNTANQELEARNRKLGARNRETELEDTARIEI